MGNQTALGPIGTRAVTIHPTHDSVFITNFDPLSTWHFEDKYRHGDATRGDSRESSELTLIDNDLFLVADDAFCLTYLTVCLYAVQYPDFKVKLTNSTTLSPGSYCHQVPMD